MPELLGLGGKLRAGKDAVGDYLAEKKNFVKLGMSDALNEALLKLNPIIMSESLYDGRGIGEVKQWRYRELHDAVGYVEAKKNPEVRRLLQVLGTEVGRDMIDPDVWVKIAERKIREHWDAGHNVVITAIRFPNELDMLKRLGGHSLWIDRSDSERLRDVLALQTPSEVGKDVTEHSEAIQGHASENSVSAEDFEEVLKNDGTLQELYDGVDVYRTFWNFYKPGMVVRMDEGVPATRRPRG